MSAELGVGVRVWVRWTPHYEEACADVPCSVATITDGPLDTKRGHLYWGMRCERDTRYWLIAIDGRPREVYADEQYLQPIDGDETERTERREEETA